MITEKTTIEIKCPNPKCGVPNEVDNNLEEHQGVEHCWLCDKKFFWWAKFLFEGQLNHIDDITGVEYKAQLADEPKNIDPLLVKCIVGMGLVIALVVGGLILAGLSL